jgi:chromosome segregation ATPase
MAAAISSKLEELRHLKKELSAHRSAAEKDLVESQTRIHSLFSRLETPINEALAYLSSESRRHKDEQDRVEREFNEQLRLKTQAEAEAHKRKDDIQSLRKQLYGARQIADNSETSGQVETAKEIRLAIQKYSNLDVNPEAYPKPMKEVETIRGIIAKAFQNEQQRLKHLP